MYNAIICRVKIFPHPNADKIQLGMAHNYQVVLPKEIENDTIGIFFPPDGQLSKEFAEANDLISRHDENGNKAGGFFSNNRRVKCQTFRGEKSEGFWCPLNALNFTGINISELNEGDQLSEINGISICNKYYTPKTLEAIHNNSVRPAKKLKSFPEHFDTKAFKHDINKIKPGSTIYLTEKLHGTSGRTGKTSELKIQKLNVFQRILLKLITGKRILSETIYNIRTGSRRVVLQNNTIKEENKNFRLKISEDFGNLLYKNEIVYYEIVGFTPNEKPIMGSVSLKNVEDKNIRNKYKKYGDTMVYSYGCTNNNLDIYVYRITFANEDGIEIDLPWPQVKRRCAQLGLKHVPEFRVPIKLSRLSEELPKNLFDRRLNFLKNYVEDLSEGQSTIDEKHIREGIIVRIEDNTGVWFLKYKSHTFLTLEGIIKNKDNYIDLEEIS